MTEGPRGCPAPRRSKLAIAGAALLILAAGAASAAPSTTSWDAYRDGAKRAKAGDLDGALASYAAARAALLSETPVDRSLGEALSLDLYNLAVSFTAASRTEEALRCFEQIFLMRSAGVKLRDASFESSIREGAARIGRYAVSVGKAAASVPTWRALAALEPLAAGPRLDLAAALLAAGDLDGASKTAEEARARDPRSPESWALTARASVASADRLAAAGDTRETRVRLEWALNDLEEALRLDRSAARLRDFATIAGRAARLLREEGDEEGASKRAAEAVAALDESAALDPAGGRTPLERGRLLLWEGRWSDAVSAFEAARKALAGSGRTEDAKAAAEARISAALALYLTAADALNEGRFEEAVRSAQAARELDGGIEASAASIETRAAALQSRAASILEESRRPRGAEAPRAESLMTMGDQSFLYGRYDEALAAYERMARAVEGGPLEAVARIRVFQARSIPPATPIRSEIDLGGTRLTMMLPWDEGAKEARQALGLAWSRVAAAFGAMPAGDPPRFVVLPNQRALRSSGAPRVGASAGGAGNRTAIQVYMEPGRSVEAWTSILARQIGMWAADRFSAGRAPAWAMEGAALWAATDRGSGGGKSAAVMATPGWEPAAQIDLALAASWNDAERRSTLLDEALALVTAIERRKSGGVRLFLTTCASGPDPEAWGLPSRRSVDAALSAAAATDLAGLERFSRAAGAAPTGG